MDCFENEAGNQASLLNSQPYNRKTRDQIPEEIINTVFEEEVETVQLRMQLNKRFDAQEHIEKAFKTLYDSEIKTMLDISIRDHVKKVNDTLISPAL